MPRDVRIGGSGYGRNFSLIKRRNDSNISKALLKKGNNKD
jgi:hypothetical protein